MQNRDLGNATHGIAGRIPALPRTAIRPYPYRYAASWTTTDGVEVNIRPIRPEDEPALVEFHGSLSEESVYLRYANMMKLSQRVAHERLAHLCFIDYDREMALVAEHVVEIGEDEGLDRITADVLRENSGMKRVSERVGFLPVTDGDPTDPTMAVIREL